ncbi:3-ketoacyl-CoA synthase 7 [Herrania umbratica]|uniref:3-ketoacyl-CoA synthase n=1 Tax=Herrania umbratica TaxID=108875 RepID=A0A6J1AGP5_9ROSI|nr:3-ketoacyl-CoA synthase 7 [Herrania umbratica]
MVVELFKCFSLQSLFLFAEEPISFDYCLISSAVVLIMVLYYTTRVQYFVYLLDFNCYRPPDNLRGIFDYFVEYFETFNIFDRESIDFQVKVYERAGVGNESCVPRSVHEIPFNGSLSGAREEIEEVLFTAVRDLLSKHKIDPKSINILVSNCSIFCPTPSITATVINKFGFRSDIKSFTLSGMGCSAGILSIGLVKDLLKVHKNSLALVLTTEAITPSFYTGKNKSMLVTNTLFRMGGAAILLSNRKQDRWIAKYRLQHIVRTHMGSDDECYNSVFQQTDEDGHMGVSLSRALLHVAAKALRTNISELAPLVLPYSEQLRYGWSVARKTIWSAEQKGTFVPNFKKAFEHFCIHAGGRAVIDAVEKSLRLQKEDVEASRMTLYRFGNTSSSSLWYELCYLEAKGRVKKGDRVWQIAFGSGFKTNSAVWKCISELDPKETNAWSDRIHSELAP